MDNGNLTKDVILDKKIKQKKAERLKASNAFERRAGKLLRQLPKVKIGHTWEF